VTPNRGMGPREALFLKLLWPVVIITCHTRQLWWHRCFLFPSGVSAFSPHTYVKTSTPLVIASLMRSGQCHAEHAENAASVHYTCLDKIVRYFVTA